MADTDLHYQTGTKDLKQDDKYTYNRNYAAHREGITQTEMVETYSKWAKDYDQDFSGKYNGPKIAADAVSNYFSKDKRDARILDVAAGTGMVGYHLNQNGFTNIDALEPAVGMVEEAKKKGVYINYIIDLIGGREAHIEDDSYDAIAISGGMGEGHIPCVALREMIRVVKPGGLVCIVMREEYLTYVEEYKDRLEPLMQELADEGKWERVSRTVVPHYSFGKNGIVFMFKVL